MRILKLISAIFGAALIAIASGAARADEAYPARAIRIVVPYSAGGTADVLARLFAQHLGALYAQQVVVDNRPGAGGHIGADLVAKSPADGYTLVLGAIGTHAGYAIYKKLPYDPATDLQAVTVLAEVPNVVIVHPSLPVTTILELIAYAKAKPGAIDFGTAGNGTSTHMTAELFKMVAGVELTHVPYRGSAPALNDLIAGQIHAMFENIPTTPPHIRSGAVRALAVTSRVRSPVLPDVPTVAEAGLPAYDATAWFTIAAPAGLPKPVLAKLSADLMGLIATPAVDAQIRELGALPVGNTPQEAERFLAAEREKWTKVIVAAGITGE
jgi:tripartite-type tricarboxylate transporter receptor subunit TctC